MYWYNHFTGLNNFSLQFPRRQFSQFILKCIKRVHWEADRKCNICRKIFSLNLAMMMWHNKANPLQQIIGNCQQSYLYRLSFSTPNCIDNGLSSFCVGFHQTTRTKQRPAEIAGNHQYYIAQSAAPQDCQCRFTGCSARLTII